jgi:RNA polymerase subunit RPABC4/transcription elongation factor Spt4
MNVADPSCLRCEAELEPDQEYCLECGARQTPAVRPEWRRALIAATVTVALTALVLVLGYERMRDDAENDAAASHAARGGTVKQAAASGPAGGSGSRKPVPGAQLAAQPNP